MEGEPHVRAGYDARMGGRGSGDEAAHPIDGEFAPPTAGGPVVVGANWYRFAPGEHIHHRHVASTSFIWAVKGSGRIRSGGSEFLMSRNALLRLPWRHEVEYTADQHSPFHVGTVHVVPWHDAAVPVAPRVAFLDDDPLLDVDYRRGLAKPEEPESPESPESPECPESPESAEEPVLRSNSSSAANVIALAAYCVERFLSGAFAESSFRALGTLLMEESASWTSVAPAASAAPTPPAILELMTDFIVANVEQHPSIAQIAAAAQCSTATAERVFARFTGMSVLSWVRTRRMQEAALLLRTSGLRASEVAPLVGFSDPLYFSRVFRATYSVPPSRYAAGQLRP